MKLHMCHSVLKQNVVKTLTFPKTDRIFDTFIENNLMIYPISQSQVEDLKKNFFTLVTK